MGESSARSSLERLRRNVLAYAAKTTAGMRALLVGGPLDGLWVRIDPDWTWRWCWNTPDGIAQYEEGDGPDRWRFIGFDTPDSRSSQCNYGINLDRPRHADIVIGPRCG